MLNKDEKADMFELWRLRCESMMNLKEMGMSSKNLNEWRASGEMPRVDEGDVRNGLDKPYKDDWIIRLLNEMREVENAICINSDGKVWRWEGIDEQEFLIKVRSIVTFTGLMLSDMCTGEMEGFYGLKDIKAITDRLHNVIKKGGTINGLC